MFKSLMKAAAVVIDVPVAVAADIVTMGGVLNDKESSHTGDAMNRFVDNVSDVASPDK